MQLTTVESSMIYAVGYDNENRELHTDYHKIITVETGKHCGKPIIRGMRITVYDVLSYLAAGMTHEQILEDFPYLTEEDIRACLSYTADRERQVNLSENGNP